MNDSIRLNEQGLFNNNSRAPDYLASAFYMLNSVQEYYDQDKDDLNRFKYTNSYQFRLKNTKENRVQFCFDEISKIVGIPLRKEKSKFYLSHDIDSVYGAILEDGFNAIKRGRFDAFLKMLFNIAIGRPDWLNIDKIMKMESEYGCMSVFYWIVNKGRINKREVNADYSFQSKKIMRLFQQVQQNGYENGIHKSISNESFQQEITKFGHLPLANRFHYLKFNLPQAYSEIDKSGIKLDASLGFAEDIGFRNSYGLPFNPYNFETGEPFSFVEVPLHIMDRTFFQYKKYSITKAHEEIFDFFEKNRENCVVSVLWHNNFFTNYKFKGYLGLYKKILEYIFENKFKTITNQEIISNYSIA